MDHNVKTIDVRWYGTFHGIGIISMLVGDKSEDSAELPIQCLSRVNVADLIKGRRIPIVHYTSSIQSILSQLIFTPVDSLQIPPYASLTAVHLDLLWHRGWILRGNVINLIPDQSGAASCNRLQKDHIHHLHIFACIH